MADFTLNIPETLEVPGDFSIETEPFREGILALHELYERQQEWISGREVTDHARQLLHRDPTIAQIALIWILWPGGLSLFWERQDPDYVRYHRTEITSIHRNIYQVLWAMQNPDHRYFVYQGYGRQMPKCANIWMYHFRMFCAIQLRIRLDLNFYSYWKEKMATKRRARMLVRFESTHVSSWSGVPDAIPV